MSDEPKVGDLYLFKGQPDFSEGVDPPYLWEEDIGIIVSYNEQTKQGRIYWLRNPDPEEGTRINSFYHETIDKDVMQLFSGSRNTTEKE